MATELNNYIEITIPFGLGSPELGNAVKEMTKLCGGSTATESRGAWVDDEGKWHFENVLLYRWNFNSRIVQEAADIRNKIVDAMFALGEKAVMVARSYHTDLPDHGYRCRIIHAPTNLRNNPAPVQPALVLVH